MEHSKKSHPYHIVDLSIWPLAVSCALFFVLLPIGLLMHNYYYKFSVVMLISGTILLLYSLYGWWRDIIREALIEQQHTIEVRHSLRIGMLLFILTELVLFLVLFCIYFYNKLFPIGIWQELWVAEPVSWAPGDKAPDPCHIPLLNTLILLLSSTTLSCSHYAVTEGNQRTAVQALGYTILLGVLFILIQGFEYTHLHFGISDGPYAASFYAVTGAHGLHVIIGVIFLLVCYFRFRKGHFNLPHSHLNFEFAIWYWHFVDIVWLLLFIGVYILG